MTVKSFAALATPRFVLLSTALILLSAGATYIAQQNSSTAAVRQDTSAVKQPQELILEDPMTEPTVPAEELNKETSMLNVQTHDSSNSVSVDMTREGTQLNINGDQTQIASGESHHQTYKSNDGNTVVDIQVENGGDGSVRVHTQSRTSTSSSDDNQYKEFP